MGTIILEDPADEVGLDMKVNAEMLEIRDLNYCF